MAEKQPFVFKQKTEDFIDYFFPVIDRFPKFEKFALITEIKRRCYSLMFNIIKTNKKRDKKERLSGLEDIDAQVEMVRWLIRHSHKRKYLAMQSYETASKMIDEVGCILGALIKGCNA